MSIPYILHVHVIPNSPKNQILGWVKDAAGDRWLKVRIAALPEDGKSNKELVKFLAKTLGLPVKQVKITGGEASRYKKLKIEGELAEETLGLLETA